MTDEIKTPTEKKNIFKENWNKIDECCPNCHQVTKRQKGITKQNIKRLFSVKFDMNETLMLIVILMTLAMAWAYQHDVAECRSWLKQFEGTTEDCKVTCNYKCDLINGVPVKRDNQQTWWEATNTTFLTNELTNNDSSTQ